MSRPRGRVAVVTGAAKGIGATTALALAAGGAEVVVNYRRSADDANGVVAAIRAAGGSAVAVRADVTRPADFADERIQDNAASAIARYTA